MRKLGLAWVLGAVFVSGAALAQDPDIGCGPGTQIWKGKEGVGPKILGATTNGTFGLQTFGISFGTLGCKTSGAIRADARVPMFAAANSESITRDMAAGDGESLQTLARLMGIDEADIPAFGQMTKTNFATIVAEDHVTVGDILATINHLMAQDPQLARYATL